MKIDIPKACAFPTISSPPSISFPMTSTESGTTLSLQSASDPNDDWLPYFLTVPYLLAMKLRALERATIDDRDYEDAVNLSIECGVSSVDELREVFRQFFPGEELPPRAALRLED